VRIPARNPARRGLITLVAVVVATGHELVDD
jgi:hypothetical protein